VPHESAYIGHAKYETVMGIDGDHSEICKFANDKSAGYKAICGVIEDYISSAAIQQGS
jgi:hypothetical protein